MGKIWDKCRSCALFLKNGNEEAQAEMGAIADTERHGNVFFESQPKAVSLFSRTGTTTSTAAELKIEAWDAT
jgi:hypothetical protein